MKIALQRRTRNSPVVRFNPPPCRRRNKSKAAEANGHRGREPRTEVRRQAEGAVTKGMKPKRRKSDTGHARGARMDETKTERNRKMHWKSSRRSTGEVHCSRKTDARGWLKGPECRLAGGANAPRDGGVRKWPKDRGKVCTCTRVESRRVTKKGGGS